MVQPSHFKKTHPYDSIFQHMETEIVARNIMVILARTGDQWRRLTWDEYSNERIKDGRFTDAEFKEFESVLPYCMSEEQARKFSPTWRSL